ncbi:MAG: hypothetical protein LC733_13435, partial [Actinobacteria bacterium]|nr:hypothetical protein [Actinomycetota bacterium]
MTLAACTGGGGDASIGPAPTSVEEAEPPPPSTTVPPPTVPPPATTRSCPSATNRAEPDPRRPRYVLSVDVSLDENVVRGTTQVRFTPDLDTDRLVFRLWPNGPRPQAGGGSIETGAVTVDGRPAPTTLDDPTILVVQPPAPLARDETVEVSLPWTLRLPGSSRDRIAREGDAVRLGSFFPILSWEPGVGWATEPATGGFAEASLAPVADFDLTVSVPAGLSVLASGVSDGPGHWTAVAMRDVALSVGRFATASATARAPNPVEVTVGVHGGVAEAPEVYLGKTVDVLADFARRFGPYPWPTFTLAITPNVGGGIEYPSHVMQSPGTSGRTLSHEIAHQWFYGLVGNDQGRDPWLDEGLASWG